MKKVACFVLCALLGIGFIACMPATINDKNVIIAKRVINATDAYLDGTMLAAQAMEEIWAANKAIDEDDTSLNANSFSVTVTLLYFALKKEDVQKVKQYRNEIAEYAGLPKYK